MENEREKQFSFMLLETMNKSHGFLFMDNIMKK